MKRCKWCGVQFEPRTEGWREQAYCSPEHRRERHNASRMYGIALINGGFLTNAALYNWYQTNVNVDGAPRNEHTEE